MNRFTRVGCFMAMSLATAVALQAGPESQRVRASSPSPSAAGRTATSATAKPAAGNKVMTAAAERELLDQHCAACHNKSARAAGMESSKKLALDTLDIANPTPDALKWRMVVQMMRTGMMPPPPMKGPDSATMASMATFIEKQLAKPVRPHTSKPAGHKP